MMQVAIFYYLCEWIHHLIIYYIIYYILHITSLIYTDDDR